MNANELAEHFHRIYERLAPQFGYETRTETRKFDPTSPNGKLMIAVCGEILRALTELGEEPDAYLIFCKWPGKSVEYASVASDEHRDGVPQEAWEARRITPLYRKGDFGP